MPNAELSYLGTINIAVRKVQDQYPNAKLLEVDGVSSSGPTTNPKDINDLTAVFVDPPAATVKIKSTVWGEWGNAEHIGSATGDDNDIPWPIEMDIIKANELKNAAGYTGAYSQVTLRWPLFPGVEEPYYIFSEGQEHIAVGVNTGTVKVFGG